jgi:hypothetical protein
MHKKKQRNKKNEWVIPLQKNINNFPSDAQPASLFTRALPCRHADLHASDDDHCLSCTGCPPGGRGGAGKPGNRKKQEEEQIEICADSPPLLSPLIWLIH